jgi:CheY-like chemotaxis protein
MMSAISIGFVWNDDPAMLLVMQYLCHERGYVLQSFTSFPDAKDHWRQHPPTVAIIKRWLTSADDGLVFCRAIRADGDLRHLPVIVGWADMQQQPFEEAYVAGANGCFGRVFDIAGVFAMVELLAYNPAETHLFDQPIPRRPRP